MASSEDRKPNYSRRFFWLAAAIVLACVLYTAGWNHLGGILVDRVNGSVASLNRDGRRASCENAEARGYPFRIGVFCQSVMFEDARGGVAFRARQFRSAAQVYAPRHIIGELDGPATLEVPGLNAMELTWSSLGSSIRIAEPLPERVSVEAKDLLVRLDEQSDANPVVGGAESFEFHMRPAGIDLDLASRFTRLQVGEALAGDTPVPPVNGLVDVVLSNGVALAGSGISTLRGLSGTMRTVSLSFDETTGATIKGPVSIDADGLIDAELDVTVRNPRELARILSELIPEAAREIQLGFSGLAAMGDNPTLPLRISKSQVRLGFLSLGRLPPV